MHRDGSRDGDPFDQPDGAADPWPTPEPPDEPADNLGLGDDPRYLDPSDPDEPEPPLFVEPVFEEPAFEDAAFDEPAYEEPRYDDSPYEEPSFEEPLVGASANDETVDFGSVPPPPDWPPPREWPVPELPEPMDTAHDVRQVMHVKKRGPLRRFTLYASGVDMRVLHFAPVDETEFVVQGSLVILTAIVASVSGLAAAGFLTTGHFVLTPVTVLVGLVWGLLIFFFDRALVSGSLNPYRFTQAEVDSLRDAGVGSPWAHLVDVVGGRRGALRRAGEIVKVSLVASLRVALALATSYIAAEMVLFLVFQPEVNARTAYLQRQLQDQRIASIQADFQAENQRRAQERAQLAGGSDAQVQRLERQVTELTPQLENARKDLGVLSAAAAAEADGNRYRGTLSDGTVVTTTGDRGIAAAARSLAQRRDNQQAIVNDLAARLSRARTALDARLALIRKDMGPALSALDDVDNQAAADHEAALRAARADPSAVTGLLLRQSALDKLEHDTHPETLVDDPVPPCTGAFAWFCVVRNWFIAPTPMGPTVAAYRAIFFVIEILPITYKVLTSLRRRRPYDVVRAALEESSNLDAIRLLDRHLHDAAGEVLSRSGQRRQHWQAGQAHAPRSRHASGRPDRDLAHPPTAERYRSWPPGTGTRRGP
jgi:hypothetical protein